jgi:hypothetical protein
MIRRCLHSRPVAADGSGCDRCGRQAQLAEGRRLRDKGQAATVDRPAGAWDLRVVLNAIKHFADSGEPFGSDDVRPLLPNVGSQVIGAAFNVARRRGLIEPIGYRQSATASRHASVVRIWRGVRPTQLTLGDWEPGHPNTPEHPFGTSPAVRGPRGTMPAGDHREDGAS